MSSLSANNVKKIRTQDTKTSNATNDTTLCFGANTQLLSMNILPGVHRINIYAPICHYFQSSTVHDECAKFWSSNNRSQLLGDMHLGTEDLSSLISKWDTTKYGEPPELDGPESKINIFNCSSQRVFLRPTFSLPRNGFFESEITNSIAKKNSTGSIEIPMNEVAKYKMASYLSFNAYSYFFPRTNVCEWQRDSKLFGNRGEVVVTVHETMTLREFVQEHISASALWKGGEMWASDLIVGDKIVEWKMGKFISSQSKFKIVPRQGERPEYEGQSTVGNGSWPEEEGHLHMSNKS